MYTLPNGLGIYRTPFHDRDGCDLAYSGPHRISSDGGSSSHGVKNYQQFLGELYRVRGEMMDKVMRPEPLDLEADCTLAVQIPVAYPGGGGHVLLSLLV